MPLRTLVFFPHVEDRPVWILKPSRALQIVEARNESELLRGVGMYQVDLILLGDARAGVALAERIRRTDRTCPVILLGGVEEALSAMRAGINDLLDPACSEGAFFESVARLVPAFIIDAAPLARIMVGDSKVMVESRQAILQVARSTSNALLTGETGTGKELAAESIHRHSSRATCPFVSVNCSAIPETLLESELFGHERGAFSGAHAQQMGKLQSADSGTVFLDEIGDMDLHAQAKILRVIESRKVHRLGGNRDIPLDIRIIAATNHDLEELIARRQFRQDLYYRLNVAHIHLPPLREHREDIPAVVDHLLADLARRSSRPRLALTPDFIERLRHYDWPGNVRELRNVLESALVFCNSGRIAIADLPTRTQVRLGVNIRLRVDERELVIGALTSAGWNKSEAAKLLHWSRMTLYRKIRKYRIAAAAECNKAVSADTV